ncbi:MAG: Eco57I restriction-modification methylase domain-containing protein [Flavobacterium sp.]|nr:Eco57I restriction-modification methylase domain-containing protein [Flavobacterium sp.]
MKLLKIKPSKSLNKAYFKQSLSREQMELFKKELQNTFNHIDEKQDEEYHKNVIADLFKNVYCKDKYLVNVNKKEDLVIRLGNTTTDDVGVLLEFKKPTEKRDMVAAEKANVKALQELVLYYLRQTVDSENHKITNLVVTNIYEWFIFDGVWFEKNIFRNSKLKKEYLDFKTSGHDTKYFYDTIAAKFLAQFTDEVPCTYFNLLDYKKIIEDNNPNNDNDLIDLYKILSPEHLLNKKFVNDSNSLNVDFYNELLYIIGLEESKDTAKKTIRRINDAERNEGSLIENTISKLKTKKYFGYENNEATENQYYEVALELCITWLNRILFLKLLESQLIKYHRGDKENYAFLSYAKIKDFDELEELFFEVLAERTADRNPSIAAKYKDIPYLNSSLFEMTDLEKNALALSNLKDRLEFPVYKKSVLKKGTKETIKPKTSLNYLLDFLDAYNFASESNAKIQEENKSIINASVLGLIFEKINGYKDGSFFTPGFITMYMCRETIRKAVVEKFKTNFPYCQDIVEYDELKDKIDHTNKAQRLEANKLINDIKIVDPAVGSGHFLVSALNEMIAIKSDLQILSYASGNRVLGYTINLDNDELIIQNQETDKLFEYTLNQNNNVIADLQELQNCLFHEKQLIIENCLFGVDINPKSVMICQLRLWIELLKNAYYTKESDYKELHTLPNIDINIKTGNSLISKFAIKDNLFERISGFQKKLQEYKNWVSIYKSTNDKKAKDVLKKNLKLFKDEFKLADLRVTKLQNDLRKLNGEFYDKYQTYQVFNSELTEKEALAKEKLEKEINDKLLEIQTVKDNPIYENAFEWRFEFPEVLDDKGNFIGFDVVIGNPPYLRPRNENNSRLIYSEYKVFENQFDLFHLFIEKSFLISNQNNNVCLIVPNTFLANENNKFLRKFILDNFELSKIIDSKQKVFSDADVDVVIIEFGNDKNEYFELIDKTFNFRHQFNFKEFINNKNYNFTITLDSKKQNIFKKISENMKFASDFLDICSGIKEYQIGKGTPPQTEENKLNRVYNSNIKIDNLYRKELRGKNINRYSISWNNEFLKYGEWLAEPRKPIFFSGERLLIRKIPAKNYLVLTYVDDDSVIDQSIYIGKPKNNDVNLKFILGCLNSKITHWYFVNLYNEFDNLFPQIKTNEFKTLPVPHALQNKQQPIISLVDQILLLKKENPKADTSGLEKDIDDLVYQLYELTPEEVEVVKNS